MLTALIKRLAILRVRLSARASLGVRGAVFDVQGRVLLVKHTYLPGWYLPGGGLDPGESAIAAFVRELREETGVELAEAPRLVALLPNPRVGPRDHVAFFVGRVAGEVLPVAGPGEIAEAGFFALDALPEGVTGATARRIAELAEGRAPAETW